MQYRLIRFQEEKYWLELDEGNYALRQIILDNNSKLHISCFEDCLVEGIVDENDLEGICKKISKDEFISVWNSVIEPHMKKWIETKARYPVGYSISGICKYFYPQGAIIKGKDYVAIYKGTKNITINESVLAQVKGYDEDNMWLVLE